MRVLMLGWEFPPHISGGLGTACQGICEGLAAAGVDISFVVPRALGDEVAPRTRFLGANRVELAPEPMPDPVDTGVETGVETRRVRVTTSRDLAGDRDRAAGAEPTVTTAPGVTSWVVDSALRPYQDAESYAHEVAGHPRRSAGSAPLTPPREDAEGWLEWTEALAREARGSAFAGGPTRYDFAGGYGSDLFEEVARYARIVAHLAREESFDLVHGHDWMTAPAAVAAARASGKPLVMHAHALERDRSGEHPNTRVQALERMGLMAADRVVAVSHYTAGIVKHDYGVPAERIRVVHNAVTQREQRAEWHVERPLEGPTVLFLGRVTMQKGPEYFLEAAAEVVRVRPDVTFVLSGSGDMLPRMIEYSARLGLARHVHFTGFLRGKDVERMYASADLYVMPSVSEPFGIAPLEAMALDVPVVLSRQSGVSEVVTHALKVDFWDTRELANKILAVLTYGPLREDLIQSGRDEVRRMRWEVRGGLLRHVYEELLT